MKGNWGLALRIISSFAAGLVGGYLWPGPAEQKLFVALAIGLALQTPAEIRRERKIRALRKWAIDGIQGDYKSVPLSSSAPDSIDLLGQSLEAVRTNTLSTQTGLRWERDRLEAVLSAMVEAVLVVDTAGLVVRANQRVEALLALPVGTDPIGLSIWDLTRDTELHGIVREAMADGQSASGEFDLIGEEARHLGLTVGSTGDQTAWVLVFHDLTEQRRLEHVRTDFVANVSHELQTPLTAIKGFADTLLSSDLSDPSTVRRYLGIINRNSERVGLLIRDLLVISDLELGRIPLQLSSVQLGPVLEEVLELLEEAARAKGVLVEVEGAGDDWVRGDHDRLVQVFVNLVDNSIKYTASGGKILVSWEATEEDMLTVRVVDNGIGIPESELPRLVERFYRVDKARSRAAGGTGLGLSIVRHIVLAHHGTLDFSSRLGFGTEVKICVPRTAAS